MIQLSRRGFLQLSFSALVTAAAAPLEQFVVTTSVPRRLYLYDIFSEAFDQEGTGFFQLARPNGATLLHMPTYSSWWFRWSCFPGNEIVIPVGEGLLNQSTCKLSLRAQVTDGQDHWVVDETGRALGLQKHTPALYTRLWVPEGDRYRLER